MSKKLLIASNNANKIKEIKEILSAHGIDREIVTPKMLDDHSEVIEDGFSFKDNAYLKAKHYHDIYHFPTLSDDSGILIDYFLGLPGVHSARFAEDYDYPEKNAMIMDMLKYVKNRKASYQCDICYIDDDIRFYEGFIFGEIAMEAKGENGFGYDPIFYLPELKMTLAEVAPENKNAISHRYNALIKWVQDLEK